MTTSGGTRASFCAWRRSSEGRRGRLVAEDLLALLFPQRCLLCGEPSRGLVVLCGRCEAELPSLEGARCQRCEEPLSDPRLDLCRACGTRGRAFDLARSLGPYDGAWGGLVRALKFERERAIVRFLSRRMADYLTREKAFAGIEEITYVPMSRLDRRRRGFNQARLLAEGVGRRLGLPVRALLTKTRETVPQAGLPAAARRENLREAFGLIRFGKGMVLLVDDIYTTGSTAEECARALKAGGCEKVFVLTVARA